jgi:hypothetical protein
MRTKWFGVALLTMVLTTDQVAAQQNPTRMGGWIFSIVAGGSANSDLQRSEARAEWLEAGNTESRLFARRLTAETSGVVGVSAGYWFNPFWGLRAQAAVAPSRLEIDVSQRETHDIPADVSVTGPSRFGAFRVWTYDAQLLFRAPVTPRGRVAVYGVVGGGLIKYDVSVDDGLPPEAIPAFADGEGTTQPVGVLGIGALVPLHRDNLAFSFELSDHVTRTPVRDAAESMSLSDDRVQVTTGDEAGPPRVRMVNHVRMLVGLTWRPR